MTTIETPAPATARKVDARTTRRVAQSKAIIEWLRGNPSTKDMILDHFDISAARFNALRCSDQWKEAEILCSAIVPRPVPTEVLDADGDTRKVWLYETVEVVSEARTAASLILTIKDAAARLDTIFARNEILEGNETDPIIQGYLMTVGNTIRLMSSNISTCSDFIGQIVEYVDAHEATVETTADVTV